jgi:hypothetical protein
VGMGAPRALGRRLHRSSPSASPGECRPGFRCDCEQPSNQPNYAPLVYPGLDASSPASTHELTIPNDVSMPLSLHGKVTVAH